METWLHAATWLLVGMGVALVAGWGLPLVGRALRELNAGFHRSVAAEPTVLVSNGRVIDHNLAKLNMSREELARILCDRGVSEPSEALAAFAHADGRFAVISRNARQHARSKLAAGARRDSATGHDR